MGVSLQRKERLLRASCASTIPRYKIHRQIEHTVSNCSSNLTVSGGFVIAMATGLFFSFLAFLMSLIILDIDVSVPSRP